MCVLGFVIFAFGWWARGEFNPGPDFSSYEAGAHAVMLHHKYKGDYGSGQYRRRAFAWGSPQNEGDVDTILGSLYD